MTFYFHLPSGTKDLTLNVRDQVLDCVYKSALYTAMKKICHSTTSLEAWGGGGAGNTSRG